ncbi:alpha-1,3-mannosyl-glycoprotein 4-beta-N-acetylglucosaminyltransferase B-like isoform X2 [Girardinichthys multiradiatus]|uniref:alpha-1,3-mannosyl-glycoprotein 4-beta-N-acetylglucosaminyltransferase B-like isoform X2 n=1 Tax=Girardinichthys multiradiatus TaxID=208333 RepID=UPI001FAB537C|nr:alpha-1,3-mannosyl-glycoprotein 4-beta-N-acetylglucosaminyltransferase B-like isoform X2 [Girardinichthys multiradiatus]
MRCYPLRVGCLLGVACFLSLSWIKSFPGDGDLQMLHKRLLEVEELGGKVSKDLHIVLEQLGNMTRTANVSHLLSNTSCSNSSSSMVKQPSDDLSRQPLHQANIHLYMPHLREHPNSLVPHVALGKGRSGVTMVLGIPTVKREKQSYLTSTLSSLLSGLTSSESKDLLIIIFVAETDLDYVNSIVQNLSKNFSKEVQSGLLEVVSPSQYYYPNFSIIKETFGDSKDRVKWRTKQNLDYSFLMLYAQDKGRYYIQLEDDVFAKTGYYSDMKAFAMEPASTEWLYLEFSQLGFIGKMFKTSDLPMIAEFFLMFHKDKPIDWLLDHILWVKVCNPEKDNKHCDYQKAMLKKRYKPSLFQHVGLHSSLPGKLQHLKDKDFEKQNLFQAHSNPPAEVSSSMKHYQEHSLDRLYKGDDFMWALSPVQGDYILISFPQPIHISGYVFRSGNSKAMGDQFYNTTVEVLPSHTTAEDKLLAASITKSKQSDGSFIVIGEFNNGVAAGEIREALQPISALRLVVHSDSDVWALLSEVHIKI